MNVPHPIVAWLESYLQEHPERAAEIAKVIAAYRRKWPDRKEVV
jgi:hypothetical protein